MPLTFYPHTDDAQKGSLTERIEVLMEAADRYKAAVMDISASIEPPTDETTQQNKRAVPRDLKAAYNWEEITRVLAEIRDLPEINKIDKTKKADLLTKLAEVYEVLRSVKMPKLEAVRVALIAEANHLKGT